MRDGCQCRQRPDEKWGGGGWGPSGQSSRDPIQEEDIADRPVALICRCTTGILFDEMGTVPSIGVLLSLSLWSVPNNGSVPHFLTINPGCCEGPCKAV